MPMDVEERYERRAPFGVPFAESLALHAAVIGALVLSVWVHGRMHGNEWGQNFDGAIQANLVSNAPSIPLPQIQKPTDNVLATENPSPAPAIEKEQTVPTPDLKAIPIPVKQPAKKEPPPKKDTQEKQQQKHPQKQEQPKDRVNTGEQEASSLPRSMAQQQQTAAPAAPISVTGGGGFRFPYYVAIIQRKTQENWLKQEVDPSTPSGTKAYIYFTINRDGNPSDVRVGESSGSASLDQSCLRAVQRVDSYGPLPSGYSGATLQVSYYCEFTGR